MGVENRDYYREDSYSSPWAGAPTASQSIVFIIIAVNVAIFVLDMFSPQLVNAKGEVLNLRWLAEFLSLKANVFQQPWMLWELLTHGFAHASVNSKDSFFHVGFNMLFLFILGRPVEQRLGRIEFLRFYLIAIVVAGLAWLLLNLGRPGAGLVGASGAVSAVVALFVFMFPDRTLLIWGVLPLKAWVLGVIIVVADLLRSLNPESHIAWEAHLAGFAFGAAYFFFKWNFSWLQIEKLRGIFKSKPTLKIHKPTASDKIKQEGEAILQKIGEHGEESLTAKERKKLTKYSEQIRKQRD